MWVPRVSCLATDGLGFGGMGFIGDVFKVDLRKAVSGW